MTIKVIGSRVSPNTISITFDNGQPVVLAKDHPAFARVKAKLASGDDTGVYELCSPAQAVRSYFNGQIEVRGGGIFFNGTPVHSALVPTILEMISRGEEPKHLLRFLVLVEQNPSMHSRKQLWDFIVKNDIVIYTGEPVVVDAVTTDKEGRKAITPKETNCNGWLVLYKGVRDDYYDQHSGKFLNLPGTKLVMPRTKVDDDQSAACSNGYHAGAFPYVQSFGSKKLLVLVNPADVVSVPHDCSAQKVRTCSYIVLSEVADTFEQIKGVAYDGKSTYQFQYWESKDDSETELVTIRAKSFERATEKFNRDFICHEVVAITKIDG